MMGWARLVVVGACGALGVAGCASILGMEQGDPVTTTGAGGTSGGGGTAGSAGGGASTGGAGGTASCVPTACPGQDDDCARRACINGFCDILIEPTGTACADAGGSYCDGAGDCVQCLSHDHCGGDPCQDHQCVAASCDDQLQNNGESDVDCGGSCGACPNGNGCFTYADCQSLVCLGGICLPCMAHLQCPSADWYCGESYCHPKKDFGAKCVEDYECKTGICSFWPITGWMCSNVEN